MEAGSLCGLHQYDRVGTSAHPTIQRQNEQGFCTIVLMRLKYVVCQKAPNKTRFRARYADIAGRDLGVSQKIGEN
ncbi:hypothetical protein G4G28_17550 [Massilia sp. Dwa41.01b]|uniref:hypothetical protein n=1 Tax=Massilia sp. Se16.2.3 TaxID=2709303 RepID=UPI0015FED2D8|nr:hypothetical protein [Massilia sp. Se16.2.3]QNA89841.1 hypothetical protein G4G28_17550 [Massilia sp. Dwa41.01b]